jgi:hypothetical protein
MRCGPAVRRGALSLTAFPDRASTSESAGCLILNEAIVRLEGGGQPPGLCCCPALRGGCAIASRRFCSLTTICSDQRACPLTGQDSCSRDWRAGARTDISRIPEERLAGDADKSEKSSARPVERVKQ